MQQIDVNCDMGESTALWPYHTDTDIALLPYISAVNLACGGHAGDEETMRRLVAASLEHDVAIGAHPSYPDKENFGRTDMVGKDLRPEDLKEIITEQLFRLEKICHEFGTAIHHIKPHGALYNRAAKDAEVSSFICAAIKSFKSSVLLYGLGGSALQQEAIALNIPFVHEVFADRTYQSDGSLTPRSVTGALIEDDASSLQQVLQMLLKGTVTTITGSTIRVRADSICIHSDGAHALAFAKNIYVTLQQQGIEIKPV